MGLRSCGGGGGGGPESVVGEREREVFAIKMYQRLPLKPAFDSGPWHWQLHAHTRTHAHTHDRCILYI